MSVLLYVLPSCLVLLAAAIAAAPWGVAPFAEYVLQVMPYMMAHLFLARGKGFVPSPVMFIAGILIDIASDGPLGFWALVYLFGMLVVRQLPEGLMDTRVGRAAGLFIVVLAITAAQVGIVSLFLLKWIDGYPALTGALVAGCITLLIDLAWRDRSSDGPLNVTSRVAGDRPAHV